MSDLRRVPSAPTEFTPAIAGWIAASVMLGGGNLFYACTFTWLQFFGDEPVGFSAYTLAQTIQLTILFTAMTTGVPAVAVGLLTWLGLRHRVRSTEAGLIAA